MLYVVCFMTGLGTARVGVNWKATTQCLMHLEITYWHRRYRDAAAALSMQGW